MPITQTDVNLANVVATALPGIIALIQSIHKADNPGVAPPTDADVLAALRQAGPPTILIDENWKAAHPA